ncbi:fimbrillin family protein [Phocaeicola vulgatus]|uniref:fimbrillin family protein n=1 Tax=Phocaeicola vulgatus TaxID=821 RepID=UPI0039B44EC3
MMKTNYLFIGMAALMIAACSNNENEPQVDDGRIAVSFAGEITLPRATTDNMGGKRRYRYLYAGTRNEDSDGRRHQPQVCDHRRRWKVYTCRNRTDHLLSFECG